MGFLKRFFRNVFHEEGSAAPTKHSSFEHVTDEQLEAHLTIDRYGEFQLTQAVRPSFDLKVVPSQGFRHDAYRDDQSKANVPVLMAAASSERLFDLFIDLLEPLTNEVDVVLETSHHRQGKGHVDLYREHIDLPVLKSILYDYEDLILNDGCTGIAILNPALPQEVQFDEHKLLIVYGNPLQEFEQIFRSYGITCRDDMKFVTEAEHVHSSNEKYADEFEQLKMRLGIDSPFGERVY